MRRDGSIRPPFALIRERLGRSAEWLRHVDKWRGWSTKGAFHPPVSGTGARGSPDGGPRPPIAPQAPLFPSLHPSLFSPPLQAPQALPRTRIIRSYPFRHNRPAARRSDGNERQNGVKNAGLENPTGSGTSLLPPHRFQTGVPAAHKANGEMYGLKGKFRMIRGFTLIGAFS